MPYFDNNASTSSRGFSGLTGLTSDSDSVPVNSGNGAASSAIPESPADASTPPSQNPQKNLPSSNESHTITAGSPVSSQKSEPGARGAGPRGLVLYFFLLIIIVSVIVAITGNQSGSDARSSNANHARSMHEAPVSLAPSASSDNYRSSDASTLKEDDPRVSSVTDIPVIPSVETGGRLDDGYSGENGTIHMVGGNNGGKPWHGFVLNRRMRTEDAAVMSGDYKTAFAIYFHKWDKGDLQAAHNLGMFFYKGLGVKKDLGLSIQFFEEAMESLTLYATSRAFADKASAEMTRN